MRTEIINSSDTNSYAAACQRAAAALRDGALVVFPTETVYGVAANAASAAAMQRLREVKAIQSERPFSVHLGRAADAARYVREPSPVFRRLARRVWPGPVTLVVEEPAPEQTDIATVCPPEQLTEIFFQKTVGLRCPDHPAASRLLNDAGAPIVASSANRSGFPPPVTLEQALEHFDGQVEFAIDGQRTRYNAASTVVEITGNRWTVQRVGAVDERTINRLARSLVLFVCTGNSCRSPMAEALFREKLGEALGLKGDALQGGGYEVASAGIAAAGGAPASSGAVDELSRRGLDITAHRAQPVTVELVQQAEKIYVMSPEHQRAVLDLVPAAANRVVPLDPDGPVSDPIGGGEAEYRQCADHIARLVEARVKEYVDEDRAW